MADFTIIHRIEAPGMVEALNNLADALRGRPQTATQATAEQQQPIQFAPQQPAVVPTVAPAAPVIPNVPAATAITPAPTAAPTPVSFDVIVAAGSQLLEAGRMNDLTAVLGSFGVQALTQLKPEQYPDVAAALRGLGAQI